MVAVSGARCAECKAAPVEGKRKLCDPCRDLRAQRLAFLQAMVRLGVATHRMEAACAECGARKWLRVLESKADAEVQYVACAVCGAKGAE